MKTQTQMFYEAHRHIADMDQAFMDLVKDPVNPLTNADLETLVKNIPQRWERYAAFIGKLES